MPQETIKQILMRRDHIDSDEADDIIKETKKEIQQAIQENRFEDAYYICQGNLGLEPDYIEELIDI